MSPYWLTVGRIALILTLTALTRGELAMTNEPRFITHCRAIVAADKPAEFVFQQVTGLDGLPRRRHFPVSVRQAQLALHHWDTAGAIKLAFLAEAFETRPHMALTTLNRLTGGAIAA